MKITTADLTKETSMLSHLILNCMNKEANLKVDEVGGNKRDENSKYDIQLLFEGVELDITKFSKMLERQFDDIVKRNAKPQAQELFEQWKQSYKSKNSTNSQLSKIKIQLDKANNQLKNIEESIAAIH